MTPTTPAFPRRSIAVGILLTAAVLGVGVWTGALLSLFLVAWWLRIAVLVRGYIAAGHAAERALVEANATLEERVRQRSRELEMLHAQLLAKEKMSSLGILAAGVAHEINNPMSFVTGNVSGLVKDLTRLRDLPPVLVEYVEDILPATLDGIARVNTIVSDLRRFARGETEDMVRYDLNREVSTALRIVHNQIKHRCRTETNLGELPPLQGKPNQMMQVIVNLVMNAAQAIEDQGVIRITTRMEEDHVLLSVKDDGIGMTPETVSKLFQPFFTTKAVGQGTGLGLSVVHGIVRSHEGTIEVSSQPGQGSEFRIRLPVGSEVSARLPTAAA